MLLAEIEFTIGIGLALTVGSSLLAIGGAWALTKYQAESAMKKIAENDEGDKELAKEVKNLSSDLGAKIDETKNDIRQDMRDLEKTMVRRIDEVKHRVTIVEKDIEHVQKETDRVAKKVTLMGMGGK
jgi:uncharacterized protein HemX